MVNWLHYLNYEVITRSSSTCHWILQVMSLGQTVSSHGWCHSILCVAPVFFFLLVRPPRSQSLLIMGWCSSIPNHRLRLPLDSGPIFSLSLLRWEIIPCISGCQEFGLYLFCLRPAPLRPTGATGSQAMCCSCLFLSFGPASKVPKLTHYGVV